jgi:hypothetical protein
MQSLHPSQAPVRQNPPNGGLYLPGDSPVVRQAASSSYSTGGLPTLGLAGYVAFCCSVPFARAPVCERIISHLFTAPSHQKKKHHFHHRDTRAFTRRTPRSKMQSQSAMSRPSPRLLTTPAPNESNFSTDYNTDDGTVSLRAELEYARRAMREQQMMLQNYEEEQRHIVQVCPAFKHT